MFSRFFSEKYFFSEIKPDRKHKCKNKNNQSYRFGQFFVDIKVKQPEYDVFDIRIWQVVMPEFVQHLPVPIGKKTISKAVKNS